MTFISRPKTLAERLAWMSSNVTGFAEEMAQVDQSEKRAAKRPATDPRQCDFWPELKSPAMAFYAGASDCKKGRS